MKKNNILPFIAATMFINGGTHNSTKRTATKTITKKANPHNLKKWDFDGLIIYAATRKAAEKKIKKLSCR